MRLFKIILLLIGLSIGLSIQLLADPIPPIVPTDPNEAFPHDTHIAPGDVYGVVEFSIPRWDVQKHKSFLKSLTSLGGSIFGKKNKEYILSIELSDTSKAGVDKLVSRAIIAHYVVDSRGKFTFNERLLNNFGQTKWRGRLIDGIVVGDTNIMTISVNGYQATSSELHSGLIDSSTQLFTEASKYVGYAPLGESVKLVWTKVRDLATQLFNTVAPPESSMVISQSDMSFVVGDQGDDRAPKTLTFKVPRDLSNPGGAAVYVKIKLLTPRSVFASDGETVDGYFKFTRPRPDVYLNEANFNGKPILDLLKEDKIIGNFVANTIGFVPHPTNVASLCELMKTELDKYFTHADSAAVMWAFLKKHKSTLLRDQGGPECVDSSKEWLAGFGLTLN